MLSPLRLFYQDTNQVVWQLRCHKVVVDNYYNLKIWKVNHESKVTKNLNKLSRKVHVIAMSCGK